MKTMQYDNKLFWKVTAVSAVRPHQTDRLEILTLGEDGEIQYKSRTVSPSMYNVVKTTFQREGLA